MDQDRKDINLTIKEFKIQYALGSLSASTRGDLVRSLDTQAEILETLLVDVRWGVRYLLAKNPNAPIRVLKILRTDNDRMVRYNALQTLESLKEWDNFNGVEGIE